MPNNDLNRNWKIHSNLFNSIRLDVMKSNKLCPSSRAQFLWMEMLINSVRSHTHKWITTIKWPQHSLRTISVWRIKGHIILRLFRLYLLHSCESKVVNKRWNALCGRADSIRCTAITYSLITRCSLQFQKQRKYELKGIEGNIHSYGSQESFRR